MCRRTTWHIVPFRGKIVSLYEEDDMTNAVHAATKDEMNYSRIALYTDLLFCLVILPLTIMLVPVERWFIKYPTFMIVLIVYLYVLYFVYRAAKLPSLFIQRKYRRIILLLSLLLGITTAIGFFPLPEEIDSPFSPEFHRQMRAQIVWFVFLIITGFSLAIELTFELFRQSLSKQTIEAEKNKAELAAVTGLSISHLGVKFREVFGVPPYRWLTERRCEAIFHRLVYGQDSFRQIGADDFLHTVRGVGYRL